jgi:hypothetical protein
LYLPPWLPTVLPSCIFHHGCQLSCHLVPSTMAANCPAILYCFILVSLWHFVRDVNSGVPLHLVGCALLPRLLCWAQTFSKILAVFFSCCQTPEFTHIKQQTKWQKTSQSSARNLQDPKHYFCCALRRIPTDTTVRVFPSTTVSVCK